MPVRFYRRKVLGASVCGLWMGGQPVYDVTVYDSAGSALGMIGPETSPVAQMYDELRRVLVAEDICA